MDDDSKQILLLKLGVGFLVFLAILIFIIIIISVKNANKKQSGLETTTRRTLSGEVVEDTTVTSWFTDETTTSSETTTTTISTTVAPTTTTTTKKNSSGGTGTTKKSSGGGSSSSSGGGQSGIPYNTYTVIGSNDSTSYHKANNSMEWGLFNRINSRTNNKYKMALELRTAAERIAEVCCQAPASCDPATREFVDQEYQLNFQAYYDINGNIDYLYNNLYTNVLTSGSEKYIGVGVIKAGKSGACGAWIIDE